MNYLIVDDEPLMLRDFERTLRKVLTEGDEVFGFDYYEDALAFAKEHKIYVAFLDIDMPEMNGLELAGRLMQMDQKTNIIFVTAYSDYMEKAWDMYVSGYLMKPVQKEEIRKSLQHLRFPAVYDEKKLEIQCFGNFECFYQGEMVSFFRAKSKEFFAYLVECRGSKVSTNELRNVLFEESEDSEKKRSYIRTLASDIRKTFELYHLTDILMHERDCYYVNLSRVDCDYYRYLKGDSTAVKSYCGEYMRQYSWAEITAARLSNTGSEK